MGIVENLWTTVYLGTGNEDAVMISWNEYEHYLHIYQLRLHVLRIFYTLPVY